MLYSDPSTRDVEGRGLPEKNSSFLHFSYFFSRVASLLILLCLKVLGRETFPNFQVRSEVHNEAAPECIKGLLVTGRLSNE